MGMRRNIRSHRGGEGLTLPRIVLVTELYPPAVGGSAILFANVYSRLPGRDVTVLTAPMHGRGGAGSIRIEDCPIESRRRGIASIADIRHHVRIAWQIRAASRGARTLVHCARGLPEGIAACLAHFAGGPRYICWAHGEEIAAALTSREHRFVLKQVVRRAAAFVANSRSTAKMIEGLGVPTARIRVAYPGVDAARFHPGVPAEALRRRFAASAELLLLSVGRLQRRKGQDLVIQALGRLRDEAPRLRYVVVGDGDERRRLETLAREHGVSDRVTFAGEVSAAELPTFFAACDIFLLPNRLDGQDIEGFGIVFLEAAAAGKPAIGGRTGGVPEAIAEGETGALVEGTSAEELAAAIRLLARSPEVRARMGEAGRRRVLERFTWERAAATVADLDSSLRNGDAH